ncbi:FxLD family lanthipeptide [Kibdelosporangium phytohabitans]|uniref:FxLD family lanthipeptide n=1 Tax=Kibdelosporangium phytohabitans TaxID=860235 RepID=UPI0009F92852|nr:FxLD family lanthipeptide [Kibdelosporangium phytohabitans]MBE1463918.1 FxLD family lantipeptide [Kibdelosporangium phytohabitans]
MTIQLDTPTPAAAPDTDFDLDISIVASGPVVADLMRNTDDNCGSSCQSACSNSTC